MQLLEAPPGEINAMREIVSWQTDVTERLRRLETKLSRHLTGAAPAATERPYMREGRLELPTMNLAFDEVLRAIPDSYRGLPVDVWFRGRFITTVIKPHKSSQNL